jgi:serine O-acetyltransferase
MTKQEYRNYLHAEVFSSDKGIKKLFRQYIHPSSHAIYLIRKMHYHAQNHRKERAMLLKFRLFYRFQIDVGLNTKIGIGLKLPHPTGIIIGDRVMIGNHATIHQHVTIGSKKQGDAKLNLQPKIGNHVVIFTQSVIVGSISIGDHVIIGALTKVDETIESDPFIRSIQHTIIKKQIT